MPTITTMTRKALPLKEFKKKLADILRRVEEQKERVVITRDGTDIAVLMSVEELESLELTLEILSEPGALEQIRQSEAEFERGEYVTAEELRAKYLKR